MSEFSSDARKLGYSKEDEYFYKRDKELLEKLKTEAEQYRRELEEENRKKEYWMRCPKCGSNLREESYGGIVLVDRCENAKCGGVYLDRGELDILLKAKSSLLKRIFGG